MLQYTKNTSFIYYAYEDGLPFFSYHKESALDNGVLFPAIFFIKYISCKICICKLKIKI